MRLRALLRRDLDQLVAIHHKHYEKEFSLADMSNLTTAFAIFDEDERLITVAGIRPIMEAVMITDKDVEINVRREALLKVLATATETTKSAGYPELHAFVQDDKWMRHLVRYGFRPTVGKSLVIGV